jgi:tetratricopeptide (TPR) repeat protein
LRTQHAGLGLPAGQADRDPAGAGNGSAGQPVTAAVDPAQDLDLAFEQATCLIRARRWYDATHVLRVIVERSTAHHQAWFNLAVAEQALGHLADARAAWDRAIALAPDDAATRAGRGEVLLDLHEWDAAAADFRAVVQAEPALPEATEARWNLSLALWKGGHVADARAELVALLDQQPRHLPALNRLAEIEWESCRQSTAAGDDACQRTVEWCRRSLAVNAAQPDVERRLRQAEDRMAAPK